MSSGNDNLQVILEDMNSKFEAVMELLVPMHQDVAEVKAKQSEQDEIKSDIKVIKAAVTDQSHQLTDH